MQRLQIRILGPLEVTDGTRRLDVGGPRQRALLARLAVSANRVVAVDTLLEELWGSDVSAGEKPALQAQASRIRRALGDTSRLVARASGYVLALEPDELDTAQFETLLSRARAAAADRDFDTATTLWSDAEALWRGPALEEFADYAFAQAEAARLDELRLTALEVRMDAALTLGRHREVVAELEALVGAHPYREQLWACLMLALYRCGRQADALGAFQRVRRLLGEGLGITPGPELVKLEEDILLQKPELAWVPSVGRGQPDDRPQGGPRADLPVSRSPFIGRDEELVELQALLRRGRLLTIAGPGGIGKTRLAIEGARGLAQQCGEVRLVELAALADPDLMAHEIGRSCDVREEPDRDPVESVVAALRTRHLLLILDNCEHLVDAAARVVDAILRGTTNVTVLATSQEPLRIDGERILRIPALSVPPADVRADELLRFDSARLFVTRASDIVTGFTVTASNVAAIAGICGRLDGIPLAIELAAARIGSVTPAELLSRLDDRFRVLRTGSRVAAPRHQTLLAAITWSYDLCSTAEQTLFRRLSVFAGGFTVAAAEAVCSDPSLPSVEVLDVLAGLVERSLVFIDRRGGEARYDLLETLRAFGAEQLLTSPEATSTRDRHLAFYADLAARGDLGIHRAGGPAALQAGQSQWLDLLELEHDNLRAALSYALGRDAALHLAAALGTFWELRNHVSEGQSWLSRVLADSSGEDTERVKAMNSLGVLHMRGGDHGRARELFELALDAAGRLRDEKLIAGALTNLAGLAGLQADLPLADRLNEEALAKWRTSADDYGVAWTLGALGWVASAQSRLRCARDLQEQSLAIRRRLGDDQGVAWSLASLGRVAMAEGAPQEARRYLEESLALCRRLEYRSDMSVALIHLGELERMSGNHAQARAVLERSVVTAREDGRRHLLLWGLLYLAALAQDEGSVEEADSIRAEAEPLAVALRNRLGVVEVLELHARSAVARSRYSSAARLLGTAAAIRDAIGAPVPPHRQAEFARTEEIVRCHLGAAEVAAATERGRVIGRRALELDDLGSLLTTSE
ncbi:MAG: tetratricopeptide repeat protein [Actinomycetota bacterium]|nr:tetratricopeptide repeat protein [Actinomycetota bacterium]